ncbi:MAG: carboxylesterase [Frondihabitans sp.]|nr:carboxylesterase [Frondihabitans sp.]
MSRSPFCFRLRLASISTERETMTDTVDVATHAGTVRGLQRPGSAAFLGIPFAEPPTGERRFAAPVPHAPWSGVLDATQYGATPQRKALSEITIIPEPSVPGESTLNVNVFTPRPGDTEAALPVLVYIHGGGYVAGSPASPWYDGAAFNRDGVVTVSVSYRLGFDGFGWIQDAPMNRGVLDWILALEWVRDNIDRFGGDPSRVTIAGQSAGGGAVLTLLAVPRAADLFERVISISGATADTELGVAEAAGRRLAELVGVEPTRAGLSSIPEGRILELQGKIAAATVEDGSNPLASLAALVNDGLVLGPVVDGDLLPTGVRDALAGGVGRSKELLLGATDNEFNMALAPHEEALAAVDPVLALDGLGVAAPDAARYVESHPGLSTAAILGQFVTDSVFRSKAVDYARAREEGGAPAWLYRFAWPSTVMGGATHCLDVPFFFDDLDAEGVEVITGPNPPRDLAADVHGAAVAFIAAGAPGWSPYEEAGRAVMVYDVPSTVVVDGYADAEVSAPVR